MVAACALVRVAAAQGDQILEQKVAKFTKKLPKDVDALCKLTSLNAPRQKVNRQYPILAKK